MTGGALLLATLLVADGTPQPILSATGEATVYVSPDVARAFLSALVRADDASTAWKELSKRSKRLEGALRKSGVKAADIKSESFSLYVDRDYEDPVSPGRVRGFTAHQSVTVTVRDFKRLGKVLDAALKGGATSIDGVAFDVEELGAALKEARTKAVADARARAKELAAAAGVTLGELVSLSESSSVPYPAASAGDYGGGGGGYGYAGESYAPSFSEGSSAVTVWVYASYEIKR